MGVNDLYNKNDYVSYINTKANKWKEKGANIYFVSVNPVNDSRTAVKNKQIVEFNNTLKSGLNSNVKYIDVYNKIINNFSTTDGLNYTKATSDQIWKYVNDYVKSN